MNITEKAALVLREIKERRAVIAKASAGPWTFHGGANNGWEAHGPWDNPVAIEPWHGGPEHTQHEELFRSTGRFIVASRNERDTELQCLETAIEGHNEIMQSYMPVDRAHRYASDALTTLCEQWQGREEIK